VVILSRVEPWVRASLPEGMKILDAIDSLAANMRERAREASPVTRWIWRAEEMRTAAAERAIAATYDRVLFVSEEEARAAGPRGVAISNGVAVRPLEPRVRRFDFGFWGRLAYFANADAARWLVDEIWPAIRAQQPSATLVIAGAHAPASLRRAAGQRPGITFLSPVDDMPALARDVRVAILPLRYGSGESTKMLEAAEAGCAVVTTPRGTRSLTALAPHAIVADDGPSLAREAVALLRDDARRDALAAELRNAVVQHYARELTLDRLAALVMRKAA
jgi:glycosyltransferase involved in cell wall biosynthesis